MYDTTYLLWRWKEEFVLSTKETFSYLDWRSGLWCPSQNLSNHRTGYMPLSGLEVVLVTWKPRPTNWSLPYCEQQFDGHIKVANLRSSSSFRPVWFQCTGRQTFLLESTWTLESHLASISLLINLRNSDEIQMLINGKLLHQNLGKNLLHWEYLLLRGWRDSMLALGWVTGPTVGTCDTHLQVKRSELAKWWGEHRTGQGVKWASWKT